MKLSRTVAYAVQATLHLAHANSSEPVPCSRLATEGQMPERFLLQILRNLVAHGILTSTRGVDGGYSLDRDPDEISLLDVIEAIDGPLVPNLPLGEGLPTESQLRLKEVISDITEESRRQLATIKLAHLLPEPATELVGEGVGH
ncbi:MAG: Rrf2 family transcriptional regulator [Pirellulales bacterium]|nr:Rrf2 family transcriptional regulator [Pirellulales bacterium]